MDPLEKRYHDRLEPQDPAQRDGGDLQADQPNEQRPWHESGFASDVERDLQRVQQQERWLQRGLDNQLLDPTAPTSSERPSGFGERSRLLVVDTTRPDWQQRVDALGPGADLLLLEQGDPGLQRIQEAIQSKPYRTITLLPGSDGNGCRSLGADQLDGNNLASDQQRSLERWQHLRAQGTELHVLAGELPDGLRQALASSTQLPLVVQQASAAIPTQMVGQADALIDLGRRLIGDAQADGRLQRAIENGFAIANQPVVFAAALTLLNGEQAPRMQWAEFADDRIQGAFLNDRNTILISAGLRDGGSKLEAVLLEEIGHWLEQAASNDSGGDEGERFSSALRGEQLLVEVGSDTATLLIDGVALQAELAQIVAGTQQQAVLNSNGSAITLMFDEPLTNPSNVGLGRFSFSNASGMALANFPAISTVAINSNTLTLNLVTTVDSATLTNGLKVNYSGDPATNGTALAGATGPVGTFSAFVSFTNMGSGGSMAPSFSGYGSYTSSTKTLLLQTISSSGSLDASETGNAAAMDAIRGRFSVATSADGAAIPNAINGVALSSNAVSLNINDSALAPYSNQTLFIRYADSSAIEDTTGVLQSSITNGGIKADVASFISSFFFESTASGGAGSYGPTFTSSGVAYDGASSRLTITPSSGSLDTSSSATNGLLSKFAIYASNPANSPTPAPINAAISTLSVSASQVTLNLDANALSTAGIAPGQTLYVAYNDPSIGDESSAVLQGTNFVDAGPFSFAFLYQSNSAGSGGSMAPSFSGYGSYTSSTKTLLLQTISSSGSLDASETGNAAAMDAIRGRFSVATSADGAAIPNAINGVALSSNAVSLNINDSALAPYSNQTLFIRYADSSAIEDTTGVLQSSITNGGIKADVASFISSFFFESTASGGAGSYGPTFTSSGVAYDGASSRLTITPSSGSLDTSSSATNGLLSKFAIYASNPANSPTPAPINAAISTLSVSASQVTLNLDANALSTAGIAPGQTLYVAYNDPSIGDESSAVLQGTNFVDAGPFSVAFLYQSNSAPSLVDTSLLVYAEAGSAVPNGSVGVLLSTLLAGVSDTDAHAVRGVAITAVSTTNGTWYYSTNGGSSWSTISSSVGISNALLLASDANTRLYFKANSVGNGTYAAQLTFRAWDQTTGSAGSTANTTTNGGSTAFSTATDTIAVMIAPINNAPLVTPGAGVTYSEQASAVAVAPSLTLSDADTVVIDTISSAQVKISSGFRSGDTLSIPSGSLLAGVTASFDATTGTLSLTGTKTISNYQAMLRAVLFANSSNDDPTRTSATRTITYSVTDSNASSAANGPQTSSASNTLTITAVNDVPTFTLLAGALDTTAEDTAVEITLTELLSQANEADVDGSVTSFQVTVVSTGSLKIGSTSAAATAWAASSNDVVDATKNLYWTPGSNANGTLNAFQLKARDNAGGLSASAIQAQVVVTAVNDAPLVSAVTDVAAAVTELADGAPSENTATLSDSGSFSIADVDLTDIQSVNVTPPSAPRGTLTAQVANNTTGDGDGLINWSYSVADSALDFLAAGQVINEVFTVTISDGQGGSVSQLVTATLIGSNDKPILSSAIATLPSGNELSPYSFTKAQLLQGFSDPDLTDSLDIDPTSVFAVGGTITYNPTTTTFIYTRDSNNSVNLGSLEEDTPKTMTITELLGGSLSAITVPLTYTVRDASGGSIAASNAFSLQRAASVGGATATDFQLKPGFTAAGGFTQGSNGNWIFMPTADFNGPVEFTYKLNSGSGAADYNGILTVGGINDAPRPMADSQSVNEDATITIAANQGLLTNDGDVDNSNNQLRVQAIRGISSASSAWTPVQSGSPGILSNEFGMLTVYADGSYSFAANGPSSQSLGNNNAGQRETAEARFEYTISDGSATSTSTLILTIGGVNDRPDFDPWQTAFKNGSPSTGDQLRYENISDTANAFNINLLEGAFDADGDPLVVENLQLAYSWNFTASALQLRPGGEAPPVPTDAVSIQQGIATIRPDRFQFLMQDEPLQLVINYRVVDPAGSNRATSGQIWFKGSNQGPFIVATTKVSGGITEMQETEAGEGLSTSLRTETGTISIQDLDLYDSQTVSVLSPSAPRGSLTAQVANNTTGDGAGLINWSYSVADSALDSLAAGQVINEVFTVNVSDGKGGSVNQLVTVTLTGTNDAPVVSAITDVAAAITELADGAPAENTATLSDSGSFSIADVDLTDIQSVNVTPPSAPRGTLTAQVANNTTGDGAGLINWSYSVADSALDSLASGQVINEVFTVNVSDGKGGSVNQLVTVTLTGTNDAPVVSAVTDVAAAIAELADGAPSENTATLSDSGSFSIADVDLTDIQSVNVTPPSAPRGTLTAQVANNTTGDGAGLINWSYSVADSALDSLAAGQVINEVFTVNVSDGKGGSVNQLVTVTITGTNDAPVISAVTDVAAAIIELADGAPAENTATLSDSGSFSIADVDLTDIQSVNVTPPSAPRGTLTAQVANNTTGDGAGLINWSYSVADSALDSLAAGQVINEVFTVNVSDGKGGSVNQLVTVTLTGTNDKPTLTTAPATLPAGNELLPYSFTAQQLLQGFSDTDLSDRLSVDPASVNAVGGAIRFDSASNTFTYTRDSSNSVNFGSLTEDTARTFTIADLIGGSLSAINVPIAYTVRDSTGAETAATNAFTLQRAAAVGGATASGFTLNPGFTAAGNFSEATGGSWTFTPTPNFNGPVQFTYSIDAGSGPLTYSGSFTVAAVNDAPVLNPSTGYGAEDAFIWAGLAGVDPEGSAITVLRVRDTTNTEGWIAVSQDPATDGSTLTNGFGTLQIRPTGTFNFLANGPLSQALATGQQAQASFTYEATDGLLTSTSTVTFTITGSNDTPSVVADTITIQEDAVLIREAAQGVLANDVDVDTAASNLRIFNVGIPGQAAMEMNSNNYIILTNSYGTLLIRSNGAYSFVADGQASQALAPGQSATTEFIYQAWDGISINNVGTTLSITITGTNDAPLINGELNLGTIQEDGRFTISAAQLLATATDIDSPGSSLSVVSLSIDARFGQITQVPTSNSWIFTPAANWNGTAELNYVISDGTDRSSRSTLSNGVQLKGDRLYLLTTTSSRDTWSNAEEQARQLGGHLTSIESSAQQAYLEEAFSYKLDSPLWIGFNDRDQEGSWTWSDGSAITFTRWAGFTPWGSMQPFNPNQTWGDGLGDTDYAYLMADQGTGNYPRRDWRARLANDSFANLDAIAEVPFIRRGDSAYVLVTATGQDQAQSNAVRLGGSLATINDAAEGAWLLSNFGTSGYDALLGKAVAEINLAGRALLTVSPVDDRPSVAPDQASVVQGQNLSVPAGAGLLANDLDPEASPLQVVEISSPEQPAQVVPLVNGSAMLTNSYGTLLVGPHGAYSFLADGPDSRRLAQGETAQTSFQYAASDGNLQSTGSLTITVTGVNDAPEPQADLRTVVEDGSVTATAATGLLANDQDPDAGAVLRVVSIRNIAELKNVPATGSTTLSDAYGTLNLSADGSYSFSADGIASQALAVGQSAQTQYTVTVSDGLINRDSTLSFSIQGTNDAPRVVPPLTNLADGVEGAPYLISSNALLADVADPDIGDPLSIRNLSVSSGNLTTSTNGAWVLTVQSSTQVNLGTGQEDTPLLFSVDQLLGGSRGSIDVRISYVVEDANGGLLPMERTARFSRTTSLAGAAVTQLDVLAGGGTASRQSDGSWLIQPSANANGRIELAYTVQAGTSSTSYAASCILEPINDPPARSSGPLLPVQLQEDAPSSSLGLETLTYTPGGGVDEATQTLSYRINSLPAAALGTVTKADGTAVMSGQALSLTDLRQLRFSPAANASGNGELQLLVSDSGGGSVIDTLSIAISAVNDGAVIGGTSNLQVVEDTSVQVVNGVSLLRRTGQFSITDVDGSAEAAFQTNVTPINGPLGQLVLSANGVFTYSVDNSLEALQALRQGEQRVDTFEIRSVDGSSRQVSFTILGSADNTQARLIDGYIQGARVFVDLNNDGQLNWIDANNDQQWNSGEGEAWVQTDSQGALNFDFGSPNGRLRSQGGTDTSTGLPFTGSLSAPAGSGVITPLTSLILQMADGLSGGTAQIRLQAAENSVRSALGISASQPLTQLDPIAALANPQLTPAERQQALAVQQRASQIANLISISEATGQGGQTLIQALAAAVQGSGNTPLDLSSGSTLSALLNANRPTGAPPVASSVVNNLATANGLINQATSLLTVVGSQQMAQGALASSVTQFNSLGGTGWLGVNQAALIENAGAGTPVAQLQYQPGASTPSNSISYRLTALAPNASLPFSIDNDGTVRVASQVPPQLLDLEANSTPFTLRVEAFGSGNAPLSSTTLTINLQNVNEAPLSTPDQLALDLRQSLTANRTAAQGLLANDTDPDASDSLAVDLSTGATLTNSYGTLTIASDGSYSFTANGAASRALSAGVSAQTNFSYRVLDALGLSSTNNLTVSITGRNEAPELSSVVPQLPPGQEGVPYTISTAVLLQGISDPDIGDNLSISNLVTSQGTVAANSNGTWTFTTNNNPAINLGRTVENTPLTFSNTDLLGGDLATLQVRLDYSVNDGQQAGLQTSRSFQLVRSAALSSFSISGLALSSNSQGRASITQLIDGTYSITPTSNYEGPIELTYQISTSQGSRSATAVLMVVPNQDPVVLVGAPQGIQIREGDGRRSLGFNAVSYGPGGGSDEASQTLSYVITAVPDVRLGLIVRLDSNNGWIAVRPGDQLSLAELRSLQFEANPYGSGLGELRFNVSDSAGGVLQQQLAIAVDAINNPPVLDGSLPTQLTFSEDSGLSPLGLSQVSLLSGDLLNRPASVLAIRSLGTNEQMVGLLDGSGYIPLASFDRRYLSGPPILAQRPSGPAVILQRQGGVIEMISLGLGNTPANSLLSLPISGAQMLGYRSSDDALVLSQSTGELNLFRLTPMAGSNLVEAMRPAGTLPSNAQQLSINGSGTQLSWISPVNAGAAQVYVLDLAATGTATTPRPLGTPIAGLQRLAYGGDDEALYAVWSESPNSTLFTLGTIEGTNGNRQVLSRFNSGRSADQISQQQLTDLVVQGDGTAVVELSGTVAGLSDNWLVSLDLNNGNRLWQAQQPDQLLRGMARLEQEAVDRSRLYVRILSLPDPSLGQIVLADGTTPVTTTATYSEAQLQSLRFRPQPNAVGSSTSPFRFELVDPGPLNSPWSTPEILQAETQIRVLASNEIPQSVGREAGPSLIIETGQLILDSTTKLYQPIALGLADWLTAPTTTTTQTNSTTSPAAAIQYTPGLGSDELANQNLLYTITNFPRSNNTLIRAETTALQTTASASALLDIDFEVGDTVTVAVERLVANQVQSTQVQYSIVNTDLVTTNPVQTRTNIGTALAGLINNDQRFSGALSATADAGRLSLTASQAGIKFELISNSKLGDLQIQRTGSTNFVTLNPNSPTDRQVTLAELKTLQFVPVVGIDALNADGRLGQFSYRVADVGATASNSSDGLAASGGSKELEQTVQILIDTNKASARASQQAGSSTNDKQAIAAALSFNPTNPETGLLDQTIKSLSTSVHSQLATDHPLYLAAIGGEGNLNGAAINYAPAATPFAFDIALSGAEAVAGSKVNKTLLYDSKVDGSFRRANTNFLFTEVNTDGFTLSAQGSWSFDPAQAILNTETNSIKTFTIAGEMGSYDLTFKIDRVPVSVLAPTETSAATDDNGDPRSVLIVSIEGAGTKFSSVTRKNWIESSSEGRQKDRYFKFISEHTLKEYGATPIATGVDAEGNTTYQTNNDGDKIFAWAGTPLLIDLNGTPITTPGYYDFTREAGSTGDGAAYIYATVQENGEPVDYIVGLNINLTNNQFGDNDPNLANIRDPGAPITVMRELGVVTTTTNVVTNTVVNNSVNTTTVIVPAELVDQKTESAVDNDSGLRPIRPPSQPGGLAGGKGPSNNDGSGNAATIATNFGGGRQQAQLAFTNRSSQGDGQSALNLQGGGGGAEGDNTRIAKGDRSTQGTVEQKQGEGSNLAQAGAGDGTKASQRGLQLDPIQQLAATASAEPKALLEQLSETNLLGTNLLDALALGAGVLYLLYGPKAIKASKGGLATLLAGFGRRAAASSGGNTAEQSVLTLFITRADAGQQQLVAARVGMGSLKLLAQRDVVADADASTLRTELSNLLAQLPRESADLLLMDPKLNQATDGLSGQLSPVAQQQQWLSSESLATPLAACNESQLAQLQAWLNKPSGTSLDGLAIADVLRARQQHYQATLPPEQASVASMIELSLALTWSQRQR